MKAGTSLATTPKKPRAQRRRRPPGKTPEDLAEDGRRFMAENAPRFIDAMEKFSAEMAGKHDAAEGIRLRAFAHMEMARLEIVRKLEEQGVTIETTVTDKSGNAHTVIRDNPLLYHLVKIHEVLGYTAKDMLLSKKARGESGLNDEQSEFLRARSERLRAANTDDFPPPRRTKQIPITVTAIEPS